MFHYFNKIWKKKEEERTRLNIILIAMDQISKKIKVIVSIEHTFFFFKTKK